MSLSCSPCTECYENITITTQTGLAFQANDFVQLHDGNNTYIYGRVVSYNSGTGVMVLSPCQTCGDIGAITGWSVALSGVPGPAGDPGPQDFSNIPEDVTPLFSCVYDIGSPTQQWYDIYLCNTIHFGDTATISVDIDNDLISNTNFIVQGVVSANTGDFGNIIITDDTITHTGTGYKCLTIDAPCVDFTGSISVKGGISSLSNLSVTGNITATGNVNINGSFLINGQPLTSGPYTRGAGIQSIQSDNTNTVATGERSIVLGGVNNTSSGLYSTIINGTSVIASGEFSFASGVASIASGNYSFAVGSQTRASGNFSKAEGFYSSASLVGQRVYASSQFSAIYGSCQVEDYNLQNELFGNQTKELYLDASNSRLTIDPGFVLSAIINISAINQNGLVNHWVRQVSIKNIGGTTSIVGSVSTIGTDQVQSADMTFTITADDINDFLKIEATSTNAPNNFFRHRFLAHVSGVKLYSV